MVRRPIAADEWGVPAPGPSLSVVQSRRTKGVSRHRGCAVPSIVAGPWTGAVMNRPSPILPVHLIVPEGEWGGVPGTHVWVRDRDRMPKAGGYNVEMTHLAGVDRWRVRLNQGTLI
jgi:hypothetical protein